MEQYDKDVINFQIDEIVHPWHYVAEGRNEAHNTCMEHFAGQTFKTRYDNSAQAAHIQWQTIQGYAEGELTAEQYTQLLKDMPFSRMTVSEFLHSP